MLLHNKITKGDKHRIQSKNYDLGFDNSINSMIPNYDLTATSTTQSMYKIRHLTAVRDKERENPVYRRQHTLYQNNSKIQYIYSTKQDLTRQRERQQNSPYDVKQHCKYHLLSLAFFISTH